MELKRIILIDLLLVLLPLFILNLIIGMHINGWIILIVYLPIVPGVVTVLTIITNAIVMKETKRIHKLIVVVVFPLAIGLLFYGMTVVFGVMGFPFMFS